VRRAWLLFLIAAVGTVYAAAIAWTGGFDFEIASTRISSHAWQRPAIVASLAFLLFILVERRRARGALIAAWTTIESPAASRLVLWAALAWTLFAGARHGSPVAGGSDSFGYLSQAHQLAHGSLSGEIPHHPAFTWTNAESTLTPLAYVRSPQPGRMSPTYPPGLSLLMSALLPLGDRAAFLLVPLFGALLVFFTWRGGFLLGDPLSGAIAALLLSLSPTFLFQAIQPMSDVPASACWAGAILAAACTRRRCACFAGVLTGMALLIRPNLAPLAMIVFTLISMVREARAHRVVLFLVPAVTAALVLFTIQAARYGSALGSGYGDAGQLFALENIPVNLRLYSRWMTFSHTPLIWLCVAAPLLLKRARRLRLFWALAALIAATWCAYLPYVSFQPDEWFYTRFLLPAIPFMLMFASMVILDSVRRAPEMARAVLVTLFVLATGLVLARISAPLLRNTAPHEQRYEAAGTFVRDALPANAIVLAAQHSGSVRYYSKRTTIRWDLAAPRELDTIISRIREAGYLPFVVVDGDEVSSFRDHFPGQRSTDRLRYLAEFGGTRVYSVD